VGDEANAVAQALEQASGGNQTPGNLALLGIQQHDLGIARAQFEVENRAESEEVGDPEHGSFDQSSEVEGRTRIVSASRAEATAGWTAASTHVSLHRVMPLPQS
jgi:hypothetical protein